MGIPDGQKKVGDISSPLDRPAQTLYQTEADLLTGLRDGEIFAFDTLVRIYSPGLKEYASRMIESADTAEDVVQDVLAWLWEHRTTIEVRGTLRAYLYGSIRNQVISVLRRVRLEERCTTEFLTSSVPVAMGISISRPDVAIEHQELAQALTRALDQLSPRVRQVALLRWRDRLSRPEIAMILGVALPTVNNQLTVAARVLRRLLAGEKKFWEE